MLIWFRFKKNNSNTTHCLVLKNRIDFCEVEKKVIADKKMNIIELKKNMTTTSEFSESIIYTDEDINERYNLHVIVPVLWSLIIVFGILGKFLLWILNLA